MSPYETLDDLLTLMVEMGGSDLHVTAGIAPAVRVHGQLLPLPDNAFEPSAPDSSVAADGFFYALMTKT